LTRGSGLPNPRTRQGARATGGRAVSSAPVSLELDFYAGGWNKWELVYPSQREQINIKDVVSIVRVRRRDLHRDLHVVAELYRSLQRDVQLVESGQTPSIRQPVEHPRLAWVLCYVDRTIDQDKLVKAQRFREWKSGTVLPTRRQFELCDGKADERVALVSPVLRGCVDELVDTKPGR